MAIIIRQLSDIQPSEITPKSIYLDRRKFMKQGVAASFLLAADAMLPAWAKAQQDYPKSKFSTTEAPNSLADITGYNNFYEFGTGKSDPAKNAGEFNSRPWSIAIEGECNKPGVFDLEDFSMSMIDFIVESIIVLLLFSHWSNSLSP